MAATLIQNVKTLTDQQLLSAYAGHRTEAAFAELVRRHVDLVYSAALRMVCDSHLAEDVAQGVFVALARSANQLADRPVLAGWLHRTAQNIAAQTVRTEVRRRAREQEAAVMNEQPANAASAWDSIAPHLDAALAALADSDRDALLLRYFAGQTAQQMGRTLGISDEAAQKRASRAIERLREQFAKRGIPVAAGGLVVVLSANAVQAAPVGLAVSIAGAATLAGTTAATLIPLKAIAMTTLQKTLVTAALTATVGAGIYEARQASVLRTRVQTLQQQQTPLARQVEQLQSEREAATNQLAALRDENARLNRNTKELLELRGEVARWRNQTATLIAAAPPDDSGTAVNPPSTLEDNGRELGRAVVRGDAGAMQKVRDLAGAEYASFNTNSAGLDDSRRGDLSRQTFAPLNAAFAVIDDAAANGNSSALAAVIQALQTPELRGMGTQSLGTLAANGNNDALTALLNYQQYGLLLSGAVGALQPAAESGNQKAIEFLAAVAQNPNDHPLWGMAAEGLGKAAASGNSLALDTLISLSGNTDVNVQNAAVSGLRQAAANQNVKAANALRSLGFP